MTWFVEWRWSPDRYRSIVVLLFCWGGLKNPPVSIALGDNRRRRFHEFYIWFLCCVELTKLWHALFYRLVKKAFQKSFVVVWWSVEKERDSAFADDGQQQIELRCWFAMWQSKWEILDRIKQNKNLNWVSCGKNQYVPYICILDNFMEITSFV